jgi:hypothetical protein
MDALRSKVGATGKERESTSSSYKFIVGELLLLLSHIPILNFISESCILTDYFFSHDSCPFQNNPISSILATK